MKIWNDDIAQKRKRTEAWWNHEVLGRAAIKITAPRRPRDPESVPADLEKYFTDPELVMARARKELDRMYYAGEAFPVVFPVSIGMVAILSYYLGCPVSFVNTDTAWSDHILLDWNKRSKFKFDRQNKWWKVTEKLLSAAMTQADGYYVGTPDLNGPTEILARLRGPEPLALDFVDCPERIKPVLKELNEAWFAAWKACSAIVKPQGSYFWWMGIWSDRPATDLQSDFSCMISSEMFNEYFLPFIEEQTRMVERTVYHLDGPGAVRHLDALLSLPKLTGIQWVPGAGAPPTIEWIPLLKRIQESGKLLFANCGPQHVQGLLEQLKPEGLLISTSCDSVEEADTLLKNVEKWTRARR